MGKTAGSRGPGGRPDPVRSFNRWKKKHSHKQSQKKQLRQQLKKPEWQVEREAISRLMQNYEKINVNEITRFSDFPLSKKTLKGLQEAQYRLVTEIQKQTIGLALQGKDVLGAAKTGSGKTLAFLVPVLEALYRLQWTSTDGLGVLIISPTRELAYQTFEVLRKVGKNHDFSAGLIIGGKIALMWKRFFVYLFRYKEDGEALLILLPSEEKGMVQQLLQKKVPVKDIKINPEKLIDIQKKLESFLAQDQDLKERAQRCFVSYIRSVYLMKDKEIFDVSKLPIPEYALSLGLAVAPRVRFLQKMQKQPTKELVVSQDNKVIEPRAPSLTNDEVEEFRAYFNEKMSILQKGGKRPEGTEYTLANGISDEEEEEKEDEEEMEEKLAKTKEPQPPSVPSTGESKEAPGQFLDRDEEEEDGHNADFFTVKRHNVFGLDLQDNKAVQKKEPSKSSVKKKVTKVAEAKKVMKRNFKVNKKITFTDEGELVQQWPQMQKSVLKDTDDEDGAGGINLDRAKERLQEEDRFDKEEYRKKIKAKHREKRLKEREARREASKKQAKVRVDFFYEKNVVNIEWDLSAQKREL
ncbi:probable ATP-dependent RNA helicase DDX10 [Leptonychotes weddellii]|uniref:ATP-dependent RNA helicase n=1 Tax=Leptonychotes weddellii TaxID=9713 RepID=A0A7F8RSC8_LEPWE|nr:probable ATP-dependent RNA helicase DDX10 [Leptonychotes weddellii]